VRVCACTRWAGGTSVTNSTLVRYHHHKYYTLRLGLISFIFITLVFLKYLFWGEMNVITVAILYWYSFMYLFYRVSLIWVVTELNIRISGWSLQKQCCIVLKLLRSEKTKCYYETALYLKYVFPSVSQHLLVQWSSLHQYRILCTIWDCVGGCCDLLSLVLCVVPLLVYPVTVNFQRRNVLASSGHLENIRYSFVCLIFC